MMLSLPFVGSQMLSASTIQAMGKALPDSSSPSPDRDFSTSLCSTA